LETSFYWFSEDVVRFKIEVGVEEKCTKCNTVSDGFSAHATARRAWRAMTSLSLAGVYCACTFTREARMYVPLWCWIEFKAIFDSEIFVLSSGVDFSRVEDVDAVFVCERHQLLSNL